MPEISIYSAKASVEAQLVGIADVTGTGISSDSIVVYVASSEAESEALRRVGNSYQGYNLQVVRTGQIRFL